MEEELNTFKSKYGFVFIFCYVKTHRSRGGSDILIKVDFSFFFLVIYNSGGGIKYIQAYVRF